MEKNNQETKQLSLEELKQKYPELAKMTVEGILNTEEFKQGFYARHEALKDYKRDIEFAMPEGVRLRRAPIDTFLEQYRDFSDFKSELLKCIDRRSNKSASIRKMLLTIGEELYTNTVNNLMKQQDEQTNI